MCVSVGSHIHIGLTIAVYIYIVYGHLVILPAKNNIYTQNMFGSGQPYIKVLTCLLAQGTRRQIHQHSSGASYTLINSNNDQG